MFNYLLKNIPAKFAFAGYCVRKSFTIMTSQVNGKLIYDAFQFTYIDNYLSFFIQMENGNYKCVDLNVEVPEATAEDIMSKHLFRGKVKTLDDYELYDKDTVIGVFGLRNIETLMKQVDNVKKDDPESNGVSVEAMLDIKNQYMGMEIVGVINNFNRYLKYDKGRITVPPVTYGSDDEFVSLIGDEMDYFDFMSNKDSDTIIKELKALDDSVDGVGNAKRRN